MLLPILYVSIAVFISLYCIFYNIFKIQIGSPPIGVLFIAYKCPLQRSQRNFKYLEKYGFSLNIHKLIKFCYLCINSGKIEFAEGVILSEDGNSLDADSLKKAQEAGLNVFTTPAISHAIFIEFPVVLSYSLTKIFAVLIGYPKIKRFSKMNNLCAYPVMEIYSKKAVTLVVPLMQQDSFVVQEAENLVFGKSYSEFIYNYKKIDVCKILFLRSYEEMFSQEYPKSSKCTKSPKLPKRITKG